MGLGGVHCLDGANHKAVVLQLSPPATVQGKPRPRFPEGMLSDEQAMLELQEQVACISIDNPEGSWAEALSVVSAAGRQWARMNSSRGFSQVEGLVRNSSPTRVIPAGWEYVEELGVRPKTHQEAYQCLASVLADEQREGRMQQSVTKLRREILSKEEQWEDSAANRKRMQRLMKEMQARRMVQNMRDSSGNYVTNKRDMARLLEEFWSPIMSPTGVREEECDGYLRSLPIPPRVQAALPLLWRPLTEDLVREALHKMRPYSSPGSDTVPAAVYHSMGRLFIPRMHAIIECSLDRGAAPEGWSTTILKCIPKSIMSETAAEHRPLAVLHSSIKWVTAVFLLHLSDIFQQVRA